MPEPTESRPEGKAAPTLAVPQPVPQSGSQPVPRIPRTLLLAAALILAALLVLLLATRPPPPLPAQTPRPPPVPPSTFTAQASDFVELVGLHRLRLEMVAIPAGTLSTGQSIRPFHLAKHEVTRALYQEVVGTLPTAHAEPMHPIAGISLEQAEDFCRKLSKLTGKTHRLPTDAEWEHACRAGARGAYYWGDDPALFGDHGWALENSAGASHRVGEKRPNAFGLHDMLGNVWELTRDGNIAQERGGGFASSPVEECRCTARRAHVGAMDSGMRVAIGSS